MPASVELRDICKSYGSTRIVKGVNLTVAPGEFVVFVGPSGCGKSTLLRMIAGLEDITAGELRFDDVVVNDWDPARRRIGMVFQSYALYPHMSVEQNVGFGLKLARTPAAEIRARVDRALSVLQLTALRHHKPAQLSGGQRQRVAIGRAIVRNPNVFLFDEPLSNLDAALRGQMRMEIGKLHRQLRNTVIYVTHDQVEAMTLADRIVVLEGGVIRQVGTPMALYERPANRFVAGFIGTPTMGFLEGRIAGDAPRQGIALTAAGGQIVALPPGFAPLARGAPVTLGVRPEHCRVCPPGQAVLTGTVVMLERLGADTFAFLDLPGTEAPLAVRLDAGDRSVVAGQAAGLRFDPDRAHLFDADGNRIPPPAP
jgi:multiple sugar transport system ATP-binding protein